MKSTLCRQLLVFGLLIGIMGLPAVGQATSECVSDDGMIGTWILDETDNTLVFAEGMDCAPNESVVTSDTITRSQQASDLTTLISRDPAAQLFPIGSFEPSVTADGRYASFGTFAVEDGTVTGQAYVWDRSTNTTELLSVTADGQPGNGLSGQTRISVTGRYVVFASEADDLVANDTNNARDIFLYDRRLGVLERVNVSTEGAQANGRFSLFPVVSANGRYVAYNSDADNLVPNDTNGTFDIFLRDRVRGTTDLISITQDGVAAGGFAASISADGRFIAYFSASGDIVTDDVNEAPDVFVYDRVRGTTELVSVASDGTQVEPPTGASTFGLVIDPNLSPDGRYVVFTSKAENLVANDTNGQTDVFVHDRARDTTERVSVASDGSEGNDASSYATLAFGGRYVTFSSSASNLVANDTNDAADVFVRDLVRGTTERVSVASDGSEGNDASGRTTRVEDDSFSGFNGPSIDWTGRSVLFESDATNLVSNDTNDQNDIFVRTLR